MAIKRTFTSHFAIALYVFCAMSLAWFVQTKEQFGSWQEASRLATIESLVERGVWWIDDSPFMKWTGDKVFLRGHFYSEKTPLLQALGAPIYAAIRDQTGVRISPNRCKPGEICPLRWLTFILVGIPSAAMLACFYWFSVRMTDCVWKSLLATLLLAWGTMIWPYSLVFNNHVPAAIALFFALQILLHSDLIANLPLRLTLSGFLTALAASFDLTVALIIIGLFLAIVVQYARAGVFFILGMIGPTALTMFFNYQISGSVLPAYFLSEGYSYPGSTWSPTLAAHHPPADVWRYAFDYLLGQHGFFMHSPILFWATAGLLLMLVRRQHRFCPVSLGLALGLVAQLTYLITRTDHFGGRAYGQRFLIVWLPVVLYYLPLALPSKRPAWWGAANLLCLSLAAMGSVFSAWQGTNSTWVKSYPLVYPAIGPEFPHVRLASSVVLDLAEGPQYIIRLGECPRWELLDRRSLSQTPALGYALGANFGNKLMLLGYDLPSRSVEPGDSLPITIYWKSLAKTGATYYQSNQLLDKHLQRWGGLDRRPLGSDTACWEPGEIWADHYAVPVNAGAPPGVYDLLIGLHEGQDEQAHFLELIQEGRSTGVANVTISPIKVGDPLPLLSRQQSSPSHDLDVVFQSAIRLMGYDLNRSADELGLRLYWQCLAPMKEDYTVFVHLIDANGAMVAQGDGPPLQGDYPTSVWQPGETIVDERIISWSGASFPPISLLVGWYEANSGRRLLAVGWPDNAVRIGWELSEGKDQVREVKH